jgi:hypothetical protein
MAGVVTWHTVSGETSTGKEAGHRMSDDKKLHGSEPLPAAGTWSARATGLFFTKSTIVRTSILGLGLGWVLLGEGCGTALLKKDAPRMERALIEAGFQTVPADTAEKVAKLQALPPYKLVKRMRNGEAVYVYADPTNCQCAYVGDAEQYTTFKRYISQMSVAEADRFESRMATEEQAEAITGEWDPL